MSEYLVIRNIYALGCNGKQGDLLFGFPATSGFLGFVHNLQLSLSKDFDCNIELRDVAIVNHFTQQNYERNDTGSEYGKYSFNLYKKPLSKTGETAPFLTEIKVNLKCSLIISLPDVVREEGITTEELCGEVNNFMNTHHFCGGSVVSYVVEVYSGDEFSLIKNKVKGNVIKPCPQLLGKASNENFEEVFLQKYIDSFTDSLSDSKVVPVEVGYLIVDEISVGSLSGSKFAFRHELSSEETISRAESVYSYAEWVALKSIESFHDISWQYAVDGDYLLFSEKYLEK